MFAVSANSNMSFEDLANAARVISWVQLYPFRDKEMTEDWLERAKASTATKAIIVTLDSQWPPKRERNIRNNYKRTRGVNYPKSGDIRSAETGGTRGEGSDPAATWKDLEWIKSATDLPVVAKGIMTGEDVELCAEVGADGVIVSNHGGRHLDNTLATIECCPRRWRRPKARWKFFSTVASGAAPMSSKRSPWGQGGFHRPAAFLGSRGGWRARRHSCVGYSPRRDRDHHGQVRPADHCKHRCSTIVKAPRL